MLELQKLRSEPRNNPCFKDEEEKKAEELKEKNLQELPYPSIENKNKLDKRVEKFKEKEEENKEINLTEIAVAKADGQAEVQAAEIPTKSNQV